MEEKNKRRQNESPANLILLDEMGRFCSYIFSQRVPSRARAIPQSSSFMWELHVIIMGVSCRRIQFNFIISIFADNFEPQRQERREHRPRRKNNISYQLNCVASAAAVHQKSIIFQLEHNRWAWVDVNGGNTRRTKETQEKQTNVNGKQPKKTTTKKKRSKERLPWPHKFHRNCLSLTS